ncbi:FdtA/QdtA family cupin domain-containing protein [Helicobacter sp. MIT 21-1697]|uniref:sugar 3,4-ketoisomerase n=1 Tax=Helicobacter sp. MIT 21-1697 TaxID=2993733 RepID=UPI00224A9F83|nr:FdtA/QdtA family cupin domain-containing protein [Helicobacter sp. MIT 21-1697]MCX2717885.1 FdtA/QdtA family cupin domain-containing protein [Helicobacter sp. MIT 21-1697]
MKYELIDFVDFSDEKGSLVACEYQKNCPFEIKRVFYIFDVNPNAVRGRHANKDSEFLFVALNGSCKVKIDDGKSQEILTLNNPKQGLYVGKMLWKEMFDFSKGCVLLVISNAPYNKDEYINDYMMYAYKVMGGGHKINFLLPLRLNVA